MTFLDPNLSLRSSDGIPLPGCSPRDLENETLVLVGEIRKTHHQTFLHQTYSETKL